MKEIVYFMLTIIIQAIIYRLLKFGQKVAICLYAIQYLIINDLSFILEELMLRIEIYIIMDIYHILNYDLKYFHFELITCKIHIQPISFRTCFLHDSIYS